MEQRNSGETTTTRATSRGLDAMPYEHAQLRNYTAEERMVIYVNQIRKMMIFFVILTVIGIIAGVIFGIVGINAIHHSQQAPTLLDY